MLLRHSTASASCRKTSEDRARVWTLPDGSLVIVVADGAGGIGGGARAAEMVVEGLVAAVAEGSGDVDWIQVLSDLDVVLEADRDAGESTVVVARISLDGSIEGASCGDSTAWRVGDDRRVDDLTGDQHRKRRLGSGRAVPLAFSRTGSKGWLVVASDGLFGTTPDETLVQALLGAQTADPAQVLVAAAKTPRGTWLDDVVVVVVGVSVGRRS